MLGTKIYCLGQEIVEEVAILINKNIKSCESQIINVGLSKIVRRFDTRYKTIKILSCLPLNDLKNNIIKDVPHFTPMFELSLISLLPFVSGNELSEYILPEKKPSNRMIFVFQVWVLSTWQRLSHLGYRYISIQHLMLTKLLGFQSTQLLI